MTPPKAAARHMLPLVHLCVSRGRNQRDPVRAYNVSVVWLRQYESLCTRGL